MKALREVGWADGGSAESGAICDGAAEIVISYRSRVPRQVWTPDRSWEIIPR